MGEGEVGGEGGLGERGEGVDCRGLRSVCVGAEQGGGLGMP